MCVIKQIKHIKLLTTTNMFWPHSPVQSIYKGGNQQHLPQADAKEQFLQRFACKVVITQPGTRNANTGTKKQTNNETKAPTHNKHFNSYFPELSLPLPVVGWWFEEVSKAVALLCPSIHSTRLEYLQERKKQVNTLYAQLWQKTWT